MNDRRWWWFLLALALAAIVIEVQWRREISWDEIEYFRATRWVAQGQVPYRDFWEHHLPLQWLLFAPAAIPLDGPGVGGPLWMRWLQLPFWIALFALANRLLREIDVERRLAALLLLLSSRMFYGSAVEYRVDTIGNFFFIGALAIRPRTSRAWFAFGALMSAAVLANMRLAPFVVVTAIIVACVDLDERRWRWSARSLWMGGGVALVAAIFAGALLVSGAWAPLVEAMRVNLAMDRLAKSAVRTFWPVLASPVRDLDLGTIALWILAIIGAYYAMRDIRRPGVLQLLTLLFIVNLLAVRSLGIHYAYHFELALLLMAPVAASVLAPERFRPAVMLGLALLLAINLGTRMDWRGHRVLEYQDTIMREVDRRTAPHEKVWDGVGYALRRPPAYKYWFLPGGIRELAKAHAIEPYDAPQMMADPPAAIIYNTRVHFWFGAFPRAAAFATRHYVPLYRNLWIPGMTALLGPHESETWIVQRSGRYRVYASELLAKHPWFSRPLKYALVAGPDAPLYAVDVRKLPMTPVTINGAAQTNLDLKRGETIVVQSPTMAGVMIVPENETMFFVAPEEQLY